MPVIDLGSPPPEGACTRWVTVDDLCCGVSGSASSDQIDLAIETASQVLWALSGRRFGACAVSVRPCRRRCSREPWPSLRSDGWGMYGYGSDPWAPLAAGCGQCADRAEDCGCSTLEQLDLPRPVSSIDAVWVDGVVLPTSAYRVDNRRHLVRLDGGLWPDCQDMALSLDQPGTFGVSYYRGRAVPPAGQMAAGELSCELIKACAGARCALPSRVTNLTRNGVSMAMLDPMDFLDKGLTGLYRVDLFLTAYNRHSLQRRASVASPETLRRRGTIQPWTRAAT